MSAEPEKSESRHSLDGIIDRFEDKMAVIITKDGQKLSWPIKELPDECNIGTAVRLIITTDTNDQAERDRIAKSMLNQILRPTIK